MENERKVVKFPDGPVHHSFSPSYEGIRLPFQGRMSGRGNDLPEKGGVVQDPQAEDHRSSNICAGTLIWRGAPRTMFPNTHPSICRP